MSLLNPGCKDFNKLNDLTMILVAPFDIFGEEGLNIEHLTNASRENYAYSMFDLSENPSEEAIEKLKKIEGVLKVRVIR